VLPATRDDNNTAWKIGRFFSEMNKQRQSTSKCSSTSRYSLTSDQSSQLKNLSQVQHLEDSIKSLTPPNKSKSSEDTNDTPFSTIDILLESADEFVMTNKLGGLCEEIQNCLRNDFENNNESFIRMRDERKYVANFNGPVFPVLNFLNDHEYLNSNWSNDLPLLSNASFTGKLHN
jgi:hypothetical protein